MLVLLQIRGGLIPMSLLNIHTGEELTCLEFSNADSGIEFFEQFNEKIFIKFQDKHLRIFNTVTRELKVVPDFDAPEAFIFLYEKEKFLTLKNGKIEIRSSEGAVITK